MPLRRAPDTPGPQDGNISVILEDYDDIFSDFDPRHYSVRGLSDDFLLECKRAVRDRGPTEFELRLLIPQANRDRRDEALIAKRLRNHFQKHLSMEHRAVKAERRKGYLIAALGAVLIFAATLLHGRDDYLSTFVFVVSEPAGWFTIWTGFERIFIDPAHHHPERDFYRRMARARITFASY